jgi:uracil-DNA glycosylase family 4
MIGECCPHRCEVYKKPIERKLHLESVALSRKELLDAVASEVIVCTKCPLWKSRRNAVPGVGNPTSRIMFIGEAPGVSEDAESEPFVGTAGKLLDALLLQIGFSREQVFITNIVKCRPPRNREPKPVEIETCTPYLDRQMLIIRPDFVVTLGSHSTFYVFSKAMLPFNSITQVRGKLYRATILGLQLTVFPTFHPASTLYNPDYKEILEHDFRLLRTKLPSSLKRQ